MMTGENQLTKIKCIDLGERLSAVEAKQDLILCMVQKMHSNGQRHIWALILMLTGTLIPLVLKVLNII